jgi:hypothetical protein
MNPRNHNGIAHLAVAASDCRARIRDTLVRRGWNVVEHPTGFHLLQAIADIIEEGRSESPQLLVVDAVARGCTGITIAAGLRDLGVQIPLVLVVHPGTPMPSSDDLGVRLAGPSNAAADVSEVARSLECESSVGLEDLRSPSTLSQ